MQLASTKNTDQISGLLLIFAFITAITLENSPLSGLYHKVLQYCFLQISIKDWICEILMVLFFLHVSIHLKKELKFGTLSLPGQIFTPLIAAFGGMVLPALIFLLVNAKHPLNWKAFAVPCATDIAFAVGIFDIITGGKRAHKARIFLLALAIFDDLGAILLIAIFYGKNIAFKPLLLVLIGIVYFYLLKRHNLRNVWYYCVGGALIWMGLRMSGIHTTICGVIVGLSLPEAPQDKILIRLKGALDTFVPIVIVPAFALATCNINFEFLSTRSLSHPITLGIFSGLFVGKQIGILLSYLLLTKIQSSKNFVIGNLRDVYLVSTLGGIGFTMSLFIGELSFTQKESLNLVKTGLVLGSLASMLWSLLFVQINNLWIKIKS